MEFNNNSPVSDEQRRLAEAKKVTVQPLHADIRPEDQPDAEIVAQHMHEPPIANIPSDTEQDTMPVQPSKELLERKEAKKPARTSVILAVTLPVAIVALITAYLLLK